MSLDGGAATSFTPSSFLTTLNSTLGGNATASFTNGQLTLSAPSGSGTGIAIADTRPRRRTTAAPASPGTSA